MEYKTWKCSCFKILFVDIVSSRSSSCPVLGGAPITDVDLSTPDGAVECSPHRDNSKRCETAREVLTSAEDHHHHRPSEMFQRLNQTTATSTSTRRMLSNETTDDDQDDDVMTNEDRGDEMSPRVFPPTTTRPISSVVNYPGCRVFEICDQVKTR